MISKMAMPELLAIFDHAPVGIVFVREGLLQHCNRRFCELSGYAEDEVFGQRARVLYESEAEYERLRHWAREALLAGDPFDAEIPMRRRDGSLIYCRLHAAAIDRDNPREGTVWIVEDLEEQTRIRDELWNAQRDLEATFAAANVGIVLIRGRRIVRANPRLAEMFCYRENELLGRSARLFYISDADFEAAGEIYPVEDLVADLLRGIDRNKALIVTPRRAPLAWWVQRLVPSYLEKHAGRLVGWAKREAERVERAASM